MSSIAYPVGNSLYLNVTNRCTNQCSFCIRNKSPQFNQQHDLWLEKEPSIEEILLAVGDPSRFEQVVFCGYGEPLIRLDIVKEVASFLKHQYQTTNNKQFQSTKPQTISIRVNTNGQANLFWGRNILPELKELIAIISVSLNAESAEKYDRISPSFFGARAWPAILDFIREAKQYISQVEATVVDLPSIDQAACRKLAAELDVPLRVRSYYEDQYVR